MNTNPKGTIGRIVGTLIAMTVFLSSSGNPKFNKDNYELRNDTLRLLNIDESDIGSKEFYQAFDSIKYIEVVILTGKGLKLFSDLVNLGITFDSVVVKNARLSDLWSSTMFFEDKSFHSLTIINCTVGSKKNIHKNVSMFGRISFEYVWLYNNSNQFNRYLLLLEGVFRPTIIFILNNNKTTIAIQNGDYYTSKFPRQYH